MEEHYVTGKKKKSIWWRTTFVFLCVVGGFDVFAHRTPCDHSVAVAAREKSLLPAAHTFSSKVLESAEVRTRCASSLQTSAFFLASQVYGLFEGMLEKLELDDDGK